MPITRQNSASQAWSAYSPLDTTITSSFRIVTLLPGKRTSPLSCTLSHENWRDRPHSYEAISYFWGNRLHTKAIHIDGKPVQITVNLESALQHFRHEEGGEPRRLWVDAICINQADSQERSQQVRQMFQIYNRATQVNVWLGDGTPDSDRGLTFMNTSLAPCFESVGFSCTDEQANVDSKFWEEWDEGKDGDCWAAIDHLMTPKYARSWSSIAQVLSRAWWGRVWIVQELISAQKATVVCGMLSVPWPLLDMTIQMMLRNTKVEKLHSKRKQEYFHDAVEDAHGLAYERSHRILDGSHATDFVMLMQITRYRGCQDPRDKVFSVLSLVSEDFQASFRPDYLLPVQVVYARAVRSYIQHSGDLHILSSCCWVKKASIPNLPSWVPDWGRAFEMSYIGGYSANETEYTYHASGTSTAIADFSDDLQTLTVSGLDIDTVRHNKLQETEDEFEYSYNEDASQEEPLCSWDIHQIAAKLEKADTAVITRPREASKLKAVLQTLTVDRDPVLGKRRQNLQLAKQQIKVWPQPLDDYLGYVRLWSQKRTLIISKGGYIGLAPSSTLPGDKICVLHGFHAPAILRARADNAYAFIGDAYIHALMDGEAVALEKMKKYKAEQFSIR
jgi:Heterokaryon incompatibility protein (HET)